MTTRHEIREKDGQFCKIEIRLDEREDGKLRLSICGVAGDVVSRREAKRLALEYWVSFFEESPDEMRDMGKRHGRRFRAARSAARFVLASDGEFHGLDVTAEENGKVYIGHSFGQIRDELAAWFPEAKPYFRHHLNDMHSCCEHQEARGETYNALRVAPSRVVMVDGEPTDVNATVCPDCGYEAGSAWRYVPLPADVVAWAKGDGAKAA